jgi:hypothetical protein
MGQENFRRLLNHLENLTASTLCFFKLNIPIGACIHGIYFNSSEKNQLQPPLLSALLKIAWRPGFILYSHHQALYKQALRNSTPHEGKGLPILQSEMMLSKISYFICKLLKMVKIYVT